MRIAKFRKTSNGKELDANNKNIYKTPQAFGKALSKVEKALPLQLEKKQMLICGLAKQKMDYN